MPLYLIPTILVGIALIVIIIFAFKALLSPKKILTLLSLVKQAKYPHAIRLAKQILAREPRNPEAHYLLGLAYNGDGKPELAAKEAELSTVARAAPGHARGAPEISSPPFGLVPDLTGRRYSICAHMCIM